MITWKSFLPVVLLLVVSNFYLLFQAQQPKTSPSSQQSLEENDIIALIDERIDVLEKRKSKQVLAQLSSRYQMAQESTLHNRLFYGAPDAPIVIQEYADIECPFCRQMHSGLKQVVDHSQGIISWEFKHFPLSNHNPSAAIEAQAIECIKAQYGNRTAWVALEKFMVETQGNGKGLVSIDAVVKSIGLNGSLITSCLKSNDHKNTVNKDYQDGLDIGIKATPAVRILNKNTGESKLVRGYKTPEKILQAVRGLL